MREVQYSGRSIQFQRPEDVLPFLQSVGFTDVIVADGCVRRADGTEIRYDGPGRFRVRAADQRGLDDFDRTYAAYQQVFIASGFESPSSGRAAGAPPAAGCP